MQKSRYAQAGVDIKENDFGKRLTRNLTKETFNENVVAELEGLFSTGYRLDRKKGNFIGQRFVAIQTESELERNIKDAIEETYKKGEPLFLTDYIAFGKLDATDGPSLVLKIMKGARVEGRFIPIIGGETAEMPGIFKKGSSELVVVITYQTDKYKEGLMDTRRNSSTQTPSFSSESSAGISGVLKNAPCFSKGVFDISMEEGNLLTTSIDSVGTKTKLGMELGLTGNLYRDMIGHAIGDTIVQLATPLGIAMYVGHSEDFDVGILGNYSSSVKNSRLANMGFVSNQRNCYKNGQFDIVGSIIGIVDEKQLLTGGDIQEGDYLIGWKCFGANTNGYSLIRKLGDSGAIDYDEQMPETSFKVGEALMLPHEDFRPAVEDALERFGDYLQGAAHITGGGIIDNVKRLLPKCLEVGIDELPYNPVFRYLQKKGNLTNQDMLETFNMGVGMVFVVNKGFDIETLPDNYHVIGKIVRKEE